MTTIAPPVTGQDIAMAARATRQVLDIFLAEQGTNFLPFATLNTIVAQGEVLAADGLVRRLCYALDVDSSTVHIVLNGLRTRGLIRQSAGPSGEVHFELTPDGQAEHQRLNGLLAPITADLYRDFNPAELAATRHVLVTLADRALSRSEQLR